MIRFTKQTSVFLDIADNVGTRKNSYDTVSINRVYNLDYLRGIAALSIMFFHYFSWTGSTYESGSVLGRLGIYGVCLFYVLSGLTLYHVYSEKLEFSKQSISKFFSKRFWRIFPLFWMATIATLLLSKAFPETGKLLLNLTGTFGIIAPDQYYAIGAWSIGNELVFYLFFPVFLLLAKHSRVWFFSLSALALAYYLYSCFFVIDENKTLGSQWEKYVNPLNHLGLFVSGLLVGYFFKNRRINSWVCILLSVCAIVLFSLFPVKGDHVNIVTGANRILFTFCCIMLCLGFYKYNNHVPFDKPLKWLGEVSYSVYILHPIVYNSVIYFTSKYVLIVSIPLSLIGSFFVYKYFEKPMMRR